MTFVTYNELWVHRLLIYFLIISFTACAIFYFNTTTIVKELENLGIFHINLTFLKFGPIWGCPAPICMWIKRLAVSPWWSQPLRLALKEMESASQVCPDCQPVILIKDNENASNFPCLYARYFQRQNILEKIKFGLLNRKKLFYKESW